MSGQFTPPLSLDKPGLAPATEAQAAWHEKLTAGRPVDPEVTRVKHNFRGQLATVVKVDAPELNRQQRRRMAATERSRR